MALQRWNHRVRHCWKALHYQVLLASCHGLHFGPLFSCSSTMLFVGSSPKVNCFLCKPEQWLLGTHAATQEDIVESRHQGVIPFLRMVEICSSELASNDQPRPA